MNKRLFPEDHQLAGWLSPNQRAYGILVGSSMYFYTAPILANFLAIVLVGSSNSYNLILAVLNVFFQLIMLATMVIILREFLIANVKKFLAHWRYEFLWCVTVGFPTMFIINALLGSLVSMLISEQSSNQSAIATQAQTNFGLIAFTSVLVAPIVEELFFRGVLLRFFSRFNVILGLVLSSLIFGFVHIYQAVFAGDLTQLVYLLQYGGMGIALGWIYLQRKNLVSSIVVHMLNNALSIVVLFISSFFS